MVDVAAEILRENGIDSTHAAICASCITEVNEDVSAAELDDLIHRRGIEGGAATVVSQRLRNVLVNWRDVLTKAIPTTATLFGNGVSPLTPLVALAAYQAWVGAFEVKLSAELSSAVEALWVDYPKAILVSRDEFDRAFSARSPFGDPQSALDSLLALGLIAVLPNMRVQKRDVIHLR